MSLSSPTSGEPFVALLYPPGGVRRVAAASAGRNEGAPASSSGALPLPPDALVDVDLLSQSNPPLAEYNEPSHAPHLPEELTPVPVPADGLCLYYCVVAARDLRRWRDTHDARGMSRLPGGMASDRQLALQVRDRLVQRLRLQGRDEWADKLLGEGP